MSVSSGAASRATGRVGRSASLTSSVSGPAQLPFIAARLEPSSRRMDSARSQFTGGGGGAVLDLSSRGGAVRCRLHSGDARAARRLGVRRGRARDRPNRLVSSFGLAWKAPTLISTVHSHCREVFIPSMPLKSALLAAHGELLKIRSH